MLTTGRFMFIIAAASVFGWLVTIEQVAKVLYQSIQLITTEKWIILLFVDIILLSLGCFIEGIAIMIMLIGSAGVRIIEMIAITTTAILQFSR